MTVEFCAGIVDKNKSLDEIAVEEVREECGYEVKASDLQKIISCRYTSSILLIFKITSSKYLIIISYFKNGFFVLY